MSAEIMEARVAKYSFTLDINAPIEKVWKSLVDETDAWWLPDFRCVPDSVVTFDVRAGGHFIESNDKGDSLLWYTVQMVTAGKEIRLIGHIAPAWSGPTTSMLHFALEEKDGATVMSVEDALHGHAPDSMIGSLGSGWKTLFGDGLKKHAEGA
jgi:uncharacterized protein YndB with AHSA1/START domain